MAAHGTTRLANGHTLTVIAVPVSDGKPALARVEERNECGTFIRFAYAASSVADAEAWVGRQVAREGVEGVASGRDNAFYGSGAINAVCDAVISARVALAIPTVEVLALVCQRFGENIARPDNDAELRAVADELGVELPTASERIRAAREARA